MKCKDCRFLEQKIWDDDKTDQHGGTCPLISRVLLMNNSSLIYNENLYVLHNFGCCLFMEKKEKYDLFMEECRKI